jgi:hypothetical protein
MLEETASIQTQQLPDSLESAIDRAVVAAKEAIAAGETLIAIELVYPELKVMPIAEQFIATFAEEYGGTLKVMFTDTGAAALARRDWAGYNFKIDDIGGTRLPIAEKTSPEDRLYIAIEPSSVEVSQIEQLTVAAADRPLILLLPRLEDATTIGIGYAARQLRDRFLKTINTVYYICPLDDATAIYRAYPSLWQVWQSTDNTYQLLADYPRKPTSEDLDALFTPESASNDPTPRSTGIFTGLQRFVRALSK